MTSRAMIRQVRDLMAAQGLKPRDIDRFVAEINRSSPAVVRALCREWLEKLGSPQPSGSSQEHAGRAEAAELTADCDEQCLVCPPERFFACVLGEGE